MNKSDQISIIGTIKKCGETWTANFPDIKIVTRSLNPKVCIDSIRMMVETLNIESPFDCHIELSDNGKLVMSAMDEVNFKTFIQTRQLLIPEDATQSETNDKIS